MSVSNINSEIHAGGHASPQKVCNENKRKKKRWLRKNILMTATKDFVWVLQKLDVTDVDKLQVNNSSHTKGAICLVNG